MFDAPVKQLQEDKTAVYRKNNIGEKKEKGLIALKGTRKLSYAIAIPASNQPRKPEFHLLFPSVLAK